MPSSAAGDPGRARRRARGGGRTSLTLGKRSRVGKAPGGHPVGPRQRESRGRPRARQDHRETVTRRGEPPRRRRARRHERRERRRRGRSRGYRGVPRLRQRRHACPSPRTGVARARVDVRRAESTPARADMDLGAHVLGFARAWAASERGGADVSEPPPEASRRARSPPRARPGRAGAEAASALGAAGITHRSNDAPRIPRRGGLARAASETERAAFEHFAATTFARARPVKRGPSEGGAFRRHVGQRRRARRFLRAAKMRRSRGGVRRLPPEGAAGGRRRAASKRRRARRRGVFRARLETKKRGGRDAAVLVPPQAASPTRGRWAG